MTMLSISTIIIALALLHNSVVCCFQVSNLPRQIASNDVRNHQSTQNLSRASSRSSLQSSIAEGDIETTSVTLSGP